MVLDPSPPPLISILVSTRIPWDDCVVFSYKWGYLLDTEVPSQVRMSPKMPSRCTKMCSRCTKMSMRCSKMSSRYPNMMHYFQTQRWGIILWDDALLHQMMHYYMRWCITTWDDALLHEMMHYYMKENRWHDQYTHHQKHLRVCVWDDSSAATHCSRRTHSTRPVGISNSAQRITCVCVCVCVCVCHDSNVLDALFQINVF